jgi:hypothetical protein
LDLQNAVWTKTAKETEVAITRVGALETQTATQNVPLKRNQGLGLESASRATTVREKECAQALALASASQAASLHISKTCSGSLDSQRTNASSTNPSTTKVNPMLAFQSRNVKERKHVKMDGAREILDVHWGQTRIARSTRRTTVEDPASATITLSVKERESAQKGTALASQTAVV